MSSMARSRSHLNIALTRDETKITFSTSTRLASQVRSTGNGRYMMFVVRFLLQLKPKFLFYLGTMYGGFWKVLLSRVSMGFTNHGNCQTKKIIK